MEHRDLLQTIAEVAAALAGFAGVISIFRRQLPEAELPVHAHSLFEPAPTVYVLALLGPLVVAGLIFVRLIIMAGRSS